MPGTPHRQARGFRPAALAGVVAGALLFLVLALAASLFVLRVYSPKPKLPPIVASREYDVAVVQNALTPEKVDAELQKVLACGSRFPGQPGMYECEQYIRRRFEEAGLELHEQSQRTAAPQTLQREISVEETGPAGRGFKKRDDIQVYPFWPNHMQPMVTPEGGLVGELVLMTSEVLTTRPSFDGCIGLIDCRDGNVPANHSFDWTAYAALGLSAIVIAHPEGLDAIPWPRVMGDPNNPLAGSLVGSVPVNYVRVAASPAIFDCVGKQIKLEVRTRWENVLNRSVYGILRAPNAAREALIITSFYDACGILPDRAPGVLQAYDPAIQLCLLDALLACRDTLKRDVVFAALAGRPMSNDGAKNLMRLLGTSQAGTQENRLLAALGVGVGAGAERQELRANARLESRVKLVQTRLDENESRLTMVERLLQISKDQPEFLDDGAQSAAAIATLDKQTAAFFDEQYRYVLNTLVLERSEETLQAKLDFERDPARDVHGPVFGVYLAAKRKYDEAQAAAGYSLDNLLRNKPEYVERAAVRKRVLDRFEELRAYHLERQTALESDIALANGINAYDELVFLLPGFVPAYDATAAQESVSFAGGTYLIQTPERIFESLLSSCRQHMGLDGVLHLPKVDRWHDGGVWREIGKSPYGASETFRDYGYQSFRLINFGRSQSYDHSSSPADLPFMHDVGSLRNSVLLAGDVALSIAHGAAKFTAMAGVKYDFKGRVLVSNVGQSIVPNYPLKNALLGTRSRVNPQQFAGAGYYDVPFAFADVYGEFDFYNSSGGIRSWMNLDLCKTDGAGFSPMACGFGDDGLIAYMKDEGEEGQRLYKSTGLLWNDAIRFKDLTIVTFRSAPVTLLDLENPQTGELYGWAELIDQDGLTPLRRRCIFSVQAPFVAFVEPDKRVFVELKAGSVENELALVTRAFMLGDPTRGRLDPKKEIDGPGYLATDTPILGNVPHEIAQSMVFLNGKRLDLLNRHGMADSRLNQYHEKGKQLLEASREPDKALRSARIEAREAVTYNELDHPVLRDSISEAVVGILWYLGLLVPFCFFFERLAFGYSDIRKQLVVQGATFLSVFMLLRLLHPAFEMVRSPLMILLGFVVVLISISISLMFSSAFKESIDALRKGQGRVRGAQVNFMGVVGTAFVLGLNNMHRRRVRTGLTCATLVLMTFVVICFTSVQSDIVEEAIAITKAPYQGFLVKKKDFEPMYTVGGLVEEYSDRYDVCEREMYLGHQYLGQSYNPTLEIVYQPSNGGPRKVIFDSIVKLAAAEPLQNEIEFITSKEWFTPKQERTSDEACPVMVPDSMARKLGIEPQDVEQGECRVMINGRPFIVQGIFSAQSYNALRDLDGLPVLPFDIEAMANVSTMVNNIILAQDSDPRIPAENIVLCPVRRDLRIQLQYGLPHRVSVAVAMPKAPYKEAKAEIDSYLERKAEAVFYGLGGVAFRGKRTRETSVTGMLDLLLPLTIAAFTVLNTMRGSVYERRDEIFVYNAVGIAPRFVFFIFFAEAAVYAVVGSVLGYLFSQGVGRILSELQLTGGMNMAFTSITTIYASLVITATVVLSTFFPARAAMQIATPSDDAGWRLPEPDGDILRFRLPFTFGPDDRIAILAFMTRYIEEHGEGSAGRFFASPPAMTIADRLDDLADGAYIPQVSCTVWLKPFDLSVSQAITLAVPTDEETGEYIAEITLQRISGTRESWLRLNVSFVRLVRQHLLHWHAVSDKERQEMFVEGRDTLRRLLPTQA